ncbi:MAG: hypothetical protein K9N05_02410 [Candidatus Marinimicrobia bacterium]|nr:hypothetical protein [Candidatus Neomarinimicrobiota bacterium]
MKIKLTISPILHIFVTIFLVSCFNSTVDEYPDHYLDDWQLYSLENKDIGVFSLHPINTDIVYAGGTELLITINDGQTWDTLFTENESRDIKISTDNIIYYATYGLFKSTDGGVIWNAINPTFPEEAIFTCFDIDPDNNDIIYVGCGGPTGGALYKSINGGIDWSQINTEEMFGSIKKLVVNPNNTDIVYASVAGEGLLFKTKNKGRTWIQMDIGIEDLAYDFNDIFCDPLDNSTTYIVSRSIFKTDNNGRSWEDISEGILENSTINNITGTNNGRLFVSTRTSLYEFIHESESWTKISNDSLNLIINDIKCSENTNKLFIGTDKGIYTINLLHE